MSTNEIIRTGALIDGKAVAAATGNTLQSINPANGRVAAEVPDCGAADVDAAVAAARRSFDDGRWRGMPQQERKARMLVFADLIEAHLHEIARLDCIDAGKPIADCEELDLPDVVRLVRWYAENIDKEFGRISPSEPSNLGLITREPVGVVGVVLPWNFPAATFAWKFAPALAAGCSIVAKPAEQTPLSAIRLAELALAADIPDGVFNVVTGGPEAGRAIGVHPDIDMVSFTGSTQVGRAFLEYSAKSNLKKIVLECGGKSPQIVFASSGSRLDEVAESLAQAAFWNAGQNCTCGSRLLVDESIADGVVSALTRAADAWVVGDPADHATKVGPLIDAEALHRVSGYVQRAERDGATVALGGSPVLRESGGWYFPPTVLTDTTPDMESFREEIFGPVVSVVPFTNEAEAIALANDTKYGLAASVYTEDMSQAHRVAKAVRAGTVSVNCYSEGDITTPFGGFGISGFGGRDNGLEALDQYTEIKTTWYEFR